MFDWGFGKAQVSLETCDKMGLCGSDAVSVEGAVLFYRASFCCVLV